MGRDSENRGSGVFKYAVRAVITMVIVAGAVMIAAALVGLLQDSRRRTAHELASRSNDLLKTRNKEWSAREQKLALLLGLHTFRMADDAKTRGIVLNALWQTPRPRSSSSSPTTILEIWR